MCNWDGPDRCGTADRRKEGIEGGWMQAAPGLGSPQTHLHRDWAHPCPHLHRGSPQPYLYRGGLTPAISVPGGSGLTQPLLHRNPKADAGRSEMAIKELENEGDCKVDAKCYPKEVCAMCSCEYTSIAEYFKQTSKPRALGPYTSTTGKHTSTQRSGPHIQVVYFVVAMSSCVGIIVFIPFGFSAKNHKCAGSQRPKLNLTPFQCR